VSKDPDRQACRRPGVRVSVFARRMLDMAGYSNKSLFPSEIRKLLVSECSTTGPFAGDLEYDLSGALAKRIESDTPTDRVGSGRRIQ